MSVDQALPYVPSMAPAETLPFPVAAEALDPEIPHIRIYSSDDPEVGGQVKWASQRLQAEVYLENDYIAEEEINPFGLYVDDYSDRSTYFYVANGRKVAAARQIYADKGEGILSLPTAKNFRVDPEKIQEAAGVRSIADLKPREVVEVSALASR